VNVTVKIYAEKNRVNVTDYQQFTLAYYDRAKRMKKRFADLAATKLAYRHDGVDYGQLI